MKQSELIKSKPCSKCGALLKSYWLKDGICNGCRNPHLIVTVQTSELNYTGHCFKIKCICGKPDCCPF